MFRTVRCLAIASTAAVIGSAGVAASPASATRSIQQPAGFVCSDAKVGVSPPRVWADRGRPETVAWVIRLDRWNGARWVHYADHRTYSTFNYYGQSVTSWSGGRFVNSRYWAPVRHRGYYRVGSVVATPYTQSAAYVAGGAHCYIR